MWKEKEQDPQRRRREEVVSCVNERLGIGVRKEAGCPFHTNTRFLYNKDTEELSPH